MPNLIAARQAVGGAYALRFAWKIGLVASRLLSSLKVIDCDVM